MELIDCALSLVRGINVFDDPVEAFKDCDYVAMVGSRPRGPGMERNDLLTLNAKIFVEQGKALNGAKSTCKVVVVGNPCNTNCLIASKNCNTIPKENFTCLTMLDLTRCKGLVGEKLGINNIDTIEGIFVLGNHSSTQVPIVDNAVVKIENENGILTQPVKTLLNDDKWIIDNISRVQKRGAEVIKARGASSAASAAMAVTKHLNALHCGSEGKVVCLGV